MKRFYILTSILIASLLMFCSIFVNAQNNNPKNSDCDLFEDFENITPANPSYAGNDNVVSPSGTWMILGHGAMDGNDRYLGEKSIRLRANNSDPATGALTIPGENTTGANVIQMQFDNSEGIGDVSFYYGSYSSHSGGKVFVEFSTDGGVTWLEPADNSVVSPAWSTVNEMQQFTVSVNVSGNVRMRIIKYKQSGTSNSINIDNICVTNYGGTSNTVSTPTFSPKGGSYSTPQQVTISCATQGATIHYTTDGTTPTTASPIFSSPINVSTSTTIKALAAKTGMDNSAIATAVYSFPVEVPNIAAFKEANTPPTTSIYKITGDVTFVYRNGRNIYIEDETAGLLVFDNATPIITNEYENGDIISGGIKGIFAVYNGLYELIPTENFPAGIPGNPVLPTILTMQHLLDNFKDYESQLVRLIGVKFDAGTFGSGAAGNIPIHQGQAEMICRNHYGELTGYTTNPNPLHDVIGFVIPFNEDRQIAPRATSDIFLNVPGNVITPTCGPNGKIEPKKTVFVPQGEGQTFTITPNYGYEIEDVLVDGASVGQVLTYTFTNVNADHTISATFHGVDIVAKPVFSPAPGTYNTEINVTITCDTDEAEIFYTTNGNEPTQSDSKYSVPITLKEGSHTIKAKAFKTDVLPSETVTASYNIVLSINESGLDKLISVYPNPTTGELRITNLELRIDEIEIFDVYGRKISSNHLITTSSNHKIDIFHLQSGVYFIKFTTDKGAIFKKVVKN
jgi:hypothetical protein